MILHITKDLFRYIIDGNEFNVHYQPIISVGKGRIIGVESLLRASYHGEPISPEAMFSYAKKENSLYKLDLCCHKHAMQGYAKGEKDTLLFVNIEASLIEDYLRDLDELLSEIDSLGIPRESIVIEINERVTEDDELLSKISKECKKAGFLVALDDVGAGHSNICRIIKVEPDIIKLDRSVICNSEENYVKQEAIRAICELSQRIGAVTIAEGTESQEEVITCMSCGVDWFQGFFFDRAKKLEAIKQQAYLPKCRSLSEVYREAEGSQMAITSERINEQKNILDEFIQILIREVQSIDRMFVESFAELYDSIECIYILNEEGIQITETIFNPKVKFRYHKMFYAMRKGDYHVSKLYYNLVVHKLNKIYISNLFISQATGNICRTISTSCQYNDVIKIICIDFVQDNYHDRLINNEK